MSDTAKANWELSEPIRPSWAQIDSIVNQLGDVRSALESHQPQAIEKEVALIQAELAAGQLLIQAGAFRFEPLVELLIKPMMHLAANGAAPALKDKTGALVRSLLDLKN